MRRASLWPMTLEIAARCASVGLVLATAVGPQVSDDFAVLASRNLGSAASEP
jgi:hypothetical protein